HHPPTHPHPRGPLQGPRRLHPHLQLPARRLRHVHPPRRPPRPGTARPPPTLARDHPHRRPPPHLRLDLLRHAGTPHPRPLPRHAVSGLCATVINDYRSILEPGIPRVRP